VDSFVKIIVLECCNENHTKAEKDPHTTSEILKICPESFRNIAKTSTVASHKSSYKHRNNRKKTNT